MQRSLVWEIAAIRKQWTQKRGTKDEFLCPFTTTDISVRAVATIRGAPSDDITSYRQFQLECQKHIAKFCLTFGDIRASVPDIGVMYPYVQAYWRYTCRLGSKGSRISQPALCETKRLLPSSGHLISQWKMFRTLYTRRLDIFNRAGHTVTEAVWNRMSYEYTLITSRRTSTCLSALMHGELRLLRFIFGKIYNILNYR
jgi:hypothetical protein